MVALPAPPSPTTRPLPFPTPLHNPTHFSTPFPTPSTCQHSPRTLSHTYPILYPTSPSTLGCKSREDEGCFPPRIRQHPPNTFNVQVAYRYSKLGISKRDDFFLVFTSFWAKNWASANVMTFFWSLLHFGQKIGHLRTCQFCSIIPSMLNIDLHPRPYTPSTFSLPALLFPSTRPMPRSPTTRPSTLASCRFNC